MEFENVLPSEIEKRSFEIIESELPHDIEKTIKPIVKRVIHTTADFDYLDNLCFSENVVEIIKNAIKNGQINPIAIIGVPVGFVNVVQAKELIMTSGVPYIVARGRKGGSNVAAAICNAIIYDLKTD